MKVNLSVEYHGDVACYDYTILIPQRFIQRLKITNIDYYSMFEERDSYGERYKECVSITFTRDRCLREELINCVTHETLTFFDAFLNYPESMPEREINFAKCVFTIDGTIPTSRYHNSAHEDFLYLMDYLYL